MAVKDLIPWRKKRREEEESLLPAARDVRDMFQDFFEDMFRPWALMRMRPFAEFPARFYPDIDVSETNKEYRVTAELPGLTKDDIDVSLQEGVLTIRGEKKEEDKEERGGHVRVERSYGSFARRIPLPSEVNECGIEADFKNGVLSVHLPKTEEAHGTRIEIKGG